MFQILPLHDSSTQQIQCNIKNIVKKKGDDMDINFSGENNNKDNDIIIDVGNQIGDDKIASVVDGGNIFETT
jgi:hypothetical protein